MCCSTHYENVYKKMYFDILLKLYDRYRVRVENYRHIEYCLIYHCPRQYFIGGFCHDASNIADIIVCIVESKIG